MQFNSCPLKRHTYIRSKCSAKSLSLPSLPAQEHARPVSPPAAVTRTCLRDGARGAVHVFAVAVLRARAQSVAVLALRIFLL